MKQLAYRVEPHGLTVSGYIVWRGRNRYFQFKPPFVLRLHGWRYAIRHAGLWRAIVQRGFAP